MIMRVYSSKTELVRKTNTLNIGARYTFSKFQQYLEEDNM